jgi:hypothetical protein
LAEQAVLDRIVGQQAVLLVGKDEAERIIPASELPPDCKVGAWLLLTTDEAGKLTIRVDTEATAQAAQRIADKMNKLKQRGRAL